MTRLAKSELYYSGVLPLRRATESVHQTPYGSMVMYTCMDPTHILKILKIVSVQEFYSNSLLVRGKRLGM